MDKRLLLVGLVVLLGCGGGGTTPGNDAAVPVDAFVEAMPALSLGDGSAADFSCLGTATAPTAGADVTASLHVVEFLSDMNVPMQDVQVFTNNLIDPAACAAPDCMTVTTDDMGLVDFTAAGGGWYAYRLPASTGTAQVLAYNRPFPTAAGNEDVTAFSMSTISTVSALLGRTFTMTAGAASGTVVDCMGRGVMNAQIRLFSGGTEIVGGAAGDRMTPRITGLEGTSPTSTRLTGSGGTFVGANAPTGDYRVEVYGAMTAGGAVERIGCEEGILVGGGITVFTVGPTRSDYATGSECGAL